MSNQLASFSKGISVAEINALIAAYAATLAHKTQHEDGGSDEISIQGLLGQHSVPLVNGALGILPVASTWGTAPTNLAYATDDNESTVTGTGSKVLAVASVYGLIDITLPSTGPYLISGKVGLWNTAGENRIYIVCKADGTNYRDSNNPAISAITTIEQVYAFDPRVIIGPNLRVEFYGTAAGTYNAKIYELYAHALRN